MPTLYHLPLDPFSRKVRIVIREKKIDVDLMVEQFWERRADFLALNPAGTVPVLQEENGAVIAPSQTIAEYLDETVTELPLMQGSAADRAEVRRLCDWFDVKFHREVTDNLFGEKLMKRFLGLGEPNSEAIRAGHTNLDTHLSYIGYLADRRTWLAGDHFSLADIAAAAQISTLAYQIC